MDLKVIEYGGYMYPVKKLYIIPFHAPIFKVVDFFLDFGAQRNVWTKY